jgi:uncharacterized damage-inducible protein DinB
MNKTAPKSFPAYYNYYIELSEGELVDSLIKAHDTTQVILTRISEKQAMHSYALGKWTIKEIVQHLIDSERIYTYRALRFARQDASELSGFEQDDYAAVAEGNRRTMADLAHEFAMVRNATIALFESFTPAMLEKEGIANKSQVTVGSIGRVCVGHEIHHMNVIKAKYL